MTQDDERKQLEAELDTTEKAFWYYTRNIEKTDEIIKALQESKAVEVERLFDLEAAIKRLKALLDA